MHRLVRRIPGPAAEQVAPLSLITREWLVTNGLGGYASGTLAGVVTRRYHGLLVAALPAPLGRVMMLNHLTERFRLPDGTLVRLGGEERVGIELELDGSQHLLEFALEMGLPVWRYAIGGFVVEKRVMLPHLQNTVHVRYRIISGTGTLRLDLQPSVHFRGHEVPVSHPIAGPYRLSSLGERFELAGPDTLPELRMHLAGSRQAFTVEGHKILEMLYRVEASRGYEQSGDLWTPGYFHAALTSADAVTLTASTEPWEVIEAMTAESAWDAELERRTRLIERADPQARAGVPAELVLAADQFIVVPTGRTADAARARAAGDEVRTVIAGYHWFTDWGRDTMISLEGLTLATGRHVEAGHILRTFALYVREGLIPNMFPEGDNEGLYHTADATLWFFHALSRYVATTKDRQTLRLLLPTLVEIVQCHQRGTRFGIRMDPADGLLHQGAEGYQLTWMDAKVGDWVVTPRRGKAVEINALWYNALRLLARWLQEEREEAEGAALDALAARAERSFNQKFWCEAGGYLYDVIEGESGLDAACRPNQVLAISLEHAVLERRNWSRVLDVVRTKLTTPVGLRSLSPDHLDYKAKYDGDLRARDAAYHQGTVWAWLVGPFIDAWLKVYPEDRGGARRWLDGFVHHLDEACIGSISEVFDAEPPFTPRGCIAQAWSVAEVLRGWLKTEMGMPDRARATEQHQRQTASQDAR